MIDWTRVRLSQWGYWCRHGGVYLGLPRAAAFTHANEGARGTDGGRDMPDDLAELDRIVAQMPHLHRQPIMAYYVREGPLWFRALSVGCSPRTLCRRVQVAEQWIDRRLAALD